MARNTAARTNFIHCWWGGAGGLGEAFGVPSGVPWDWSLSEYLLSLLPNEGLVGGKELGFPPFRRD